MNLILLWPEDWKEREEEGENKVDESGAHAAQETTSSVTGTGSSRHAHTVRGSAVLADDRRVGHVRNVIRAQVGDSLKVGEVDGLIGTATVTVLAHDRVVLDVRLTLPPPPPSPVTLVLALPEKTTFAHVLHQVTVLGVKRVYVVGAAAVPGSWWGSHVLRRDSIREMLTLGLEQTIDTLMPVVHLRQDTNGFITCELPEILRDSHGLLLERQPSDAVRMEQCHTTIEKVTLIVGPADNFTDVEQARFLALGCSTVSFGRRALPVTAAVHALVGRLTL